MLNCSAIRACFASYEESSNRVPCIKHFQANVNRQFLLLFAR